MTPPDTPIPSFEDQGHGIEREPFGSVNGVEASVFTLTNKNGMRAQISDFGGVVVSLTAPDRDGVMADVVLGLDDAATYAEKSPFFGALIGRYANRIAAGHFRLNGETFELPVNDPPNTLHGGPGGFHNLFWKANPMQTEDGPALSLSLVSPHGDAGFPGALSVEVIYCLTQDNELAITYRAETDHATPVALTHHSYFNLSGDLSRPVEGHVLQIEADRYTPVDDTFIPTGVLADVADTPFDFREAKPVGRDIDAADDQLALGGGYDHNFVLARNSDAMARVATLYEPDSGRRMEVLTTEPGLQFYAGNKLDGSLTGKGIAYPARSGLCLETQAFPDSPNQPAFPDTILRPEETYRSRTVYRFTAD